MVDLVGDVDGGGTAGGASMEGDGEGDDDGSGPEKAVMTGGAFPAVDIFGLAKCVRIDET